MSTIDLKGNTLEVDAIVLDGVALTGGATLEDVTASAAEINVLDGATAANDTTGLAAILGTDGAMTLAGSLTVGTEALAEATVALINALPTVDPADGVTVWNDGGVLKVATPA